MRKLTMCWWVVGGVAAAAGCSGDLYVGSGGGDAGAGGSGAAGNGTGGGAASVNPSKGGGAGLTGSSGTRSGGRGGGSSIAGDPGGESAEGGSAGDVAQAGAGPAGGRAGTGQMGGGGGEDTNGNSGMGGESALPPTCDCQSSPGLTLLECGRDVPYPVLVSADGTNGMFGKATNEAWSLASWIVGREPLLERTADLLPFALSADGKTALFNHPIFDPDFPWVTDSYLTLWTEAEGEHWLPLEFQGWLLSADGKTVVGRREGSQFENLAFHTLGGGMTVTDFSAELGRAFLEPKATNADASVVGGRFGLTSETSAAPFLWRSSGLVQLGTLPSAAPGTPPDGVVTALSADGTVAVGVTRVGPDDTHFFRWTEAEGMVDIGSCRFDSWDCLSLPDVRDLRLSEDGQVIAGTVASDSTLPTAHAFRRVGNSTVELTPGIYSESRDMSSDGTVVVGNIVDSTLSSEEPFVWDEAQGARTLRSALLAAEVDLRGWTLTYAVNLSRDGHVMLGYGRCGDGAALYRAVIPDQVTETNEEER